MTFEPFISERARLRADILFLSFEVKLLRAARLLGRLQRKDDDDRGPDGDADDKPSYALGPDAQGIVTLTDAPYQVAQNFPKDHNGPPEVIGEDRPDLQDIPREKPYGRGTLSPALRMFSGLLLLYDLVALVRLAPWIAAYQPEIISNNDPPKTLAELQKDVGISKPGYEDHHIVEQTSAERDGFSRELIDGRSNIVKIPTLKHREITKWYSDGNDAFGGLTPRQYLQGKSWEERQRIGIEQLIKAGVLKP